MSKAEITFLGGYLIQFNQTSSVRSCIYVVGVVSYLVNSHLGINPVMTVIWRHQCMHLPLDKEEKGPPQFSRLFRYSYPAILLQIVTRMYGESTDSS